MPPQKSQSVRESPLDMSHTMRMGSLIRGTKFFAPYCVEKLDQTI